MIEGRHDQDGQERERGQKLDDLLGTRFLSGGARADAACEERLIALPKVEGDRRRCYRKEEEIQPGLPETKRPRRGEKRDGEAKDEIGKAERCLRGECAHAVNVNHLGILSHVARFLVAREWPPIWK